MIKAEKNIGESIGMSAFVGGNKLSKSITNNLTTTVGGLNIPNLYRVQNSKDRPYVEDFTSNKRINSIYGGISLSYKSWLFWDLNGRNDWSSTLPVNRNSYFYPSSSISYIFSEHLHSSILSYGKVRLGIAKVGADTDPYNLYNIYFSNESFNNHPSYTVSNTLNNQNLKPENTNSIELGTDLRFLKNRIGIDLTIYKSKTVNQILPLNTSSATGYDKQFINAGEITNKGIEIELNGTPIESKNLSWNIHFNIGKNINRVVELNKEDPTLTNIFSEKDPFGLVSLNAYEGRSYGTLLGKDYLRDKDGNRLIDPNGFYLITDDVVPIGNTTPDFTGGIKNTLSCKGFSLGVLVDFRKGGDIFSLSNLWGNYSGQFQSTVEGGIREKGVIADGVVASLDANGLPILLNEGNPNVKGDETYTSTGEKNKIVIDAQSHFYYNGGSIVNSADVYDGSFIKLREMNLTYTLPKTWSNKIRFTNLEVSVIARNLAILFKNIPNLDPDNAISTSNIQGFEGGQAASTRSIGFSLNAKF